MTGGDISPDGKWLLYRQNDSKAGLPGVWAPTLSWLIRKPLIGGEPAGIMQITGNEEYHCASVPTAMPACVLSHVDGGKTAFYALDPVQGKGRRLAEVPYTPKHVANIWNISPDGAQIALLDVDEPGARIVVIATADGSFRVVPVDSDAVKPQSISWSADGKSFYVSSLGEDTCELVHITMAGKTHVLWGTKRTHWLINPMPSPDGKHLAFTAQSWDANVWIIDNF